MRKHTVNILLAGKSGVGKSTLLNYLFDEKDLRKTGVGEPVTERGFYTETKDFGDILLNLTDSWGIEADRTKDWEDDFQKYIYNHSFEKGPRHWVHSAIYCIDATGARVQLYEIDILEKIIKSNIHPVVVFTKSYATSQEDQEKLKHEIIKHEKLKDIPIVFVNSVKIDSFLEGEKKPFGKKEVLQAINKQYIKVLETDNRIQNYVNHYMMKYLSNEIEMLDAQLENRTFKQKRDPDYTDELVKISVKNFQKKTDDFLTETLKDIYTVYAFFKANYSDFVISELDDLKKIREKYAKNFLKNPIIWFRVNFAQHKELKKDNVIKNFRREVIKMKDEALYEFTKKIEGLREGTPLARNTLG